MVRLRGCLRPAAAALVVGGLLVLGGAPAGLAGVIAAVTVARERRRARGQRAERDEAAFVLAALETLGLELRCGAAPLTALQAIGAPGSTSQAETALLAAGRAETMAEAARQLDRGPPALRALAGAMRLSEAAGTSLAGLTDALCTPLRAQREADRELSDALAGVRSSANLLTGLPALGLLLAQGIGAQPLSVLLHTTAGAICLVLGTGLGSLGRVWTGALVRRAHAVGLS